MKKLIENLLLSAGIGMVVAFALRLLLRGVIEAVDHVDEIAQRQAARHAYGPLVSVPREPRDGEAIDMTAEQDATSQSDDIAKHRYAPGKRPWDDDVLGQFADPLNYTIDDPFIDDGALPVMQPFSSPIVFEDRGGGRDTEV